MRRGDGGVRAILAMAALALAALIPCAGAEAWTLSSAADMRACERSGLSLPDDVGAVRLALAAPAWDLLDTAWPSLEGWSRAGVGSQAVLDVDIPGELVVSDTSNALDPSITRKGIGISDSDDWSLETTLRFMGEGGLRICVEAWSRGPCIVLSPGGVSSVDDRGQLRVQWDGRTDTTEFHTWRILYSGDSGSFNLYRDGSRVMSRGDSIRRVFITENRNTVHISAVGTQERPTNVVVKDLRIGRGRSSGYVASGTLISQPHDTVIPDVVYQTLSWKAEATGACRVSLQLRSAKTREALALAPWLGPSKDVPSYGSPGARVNVLHYGDPWVQLRAELASDGACTPVLRELALSYANSSAVAQDPEALDATLRLISSQNCTVPPALKDRYFTLLNRYDTTVHSLPRRIAFRITDDDIAKLNGTLEKIDGILRECAGQTDLNLAESEVSTLEEKLNLTAFDAILQWADIFGVLGVLTAALIVAKKRVLGHEEVEVTRGVTREGNTIKIGVKVANHSTFTITDVDVSLDVPEAFEVEHGSKLIQLGAIKPGEFQSAIFHLIPHRCVSANIGGTVVYHDSRGTRKMVEFEPVNAGSVCPFLAPVALNPLEFKKRIAEMPSDQATIELGISPKEAVSRVTGRFSGIHTVKQVVDREKQTVDLVYAGMGAYSKKFIGVWIRMDLGLGVVYLTVFGEQKEMITGLISELVDHLTEKETSRDAYARGRAGGGRGYAASARPRGEGARPAAEGAEGSDGAEGGSVATGPAPGAAAADAGGGGPLPEDDEDDDILGKQGGTP